MDWTAIASFVVAGITGVYVILVYKQLKVMTTQSIALYTLWSGRENSFRSKIGTIHIRNLSHQHGIYNIKISIAILDNNELQCFAGKNITHIEPNGDFCVEIKELTLPCDNEKQMSKWFDKYKKGNTVGIVVVEYESIFGLKNKVLLTFERTPKKAIVNGKIIFLKKFPWLRWKKLVDYLMRKTIAKR